MAILSLLAYSLTTITELAEASNMDEYELEPSPFYFNPDTVVGLYKGHSLARNRLPVVVKRHDFTLMQHKGTQIRMAQTINAALVQAKVQHPNACDILEVQIEVDRTNCTIYHVLEALEGDVEQDIEERKESGRPYEEEDLRQVLQQTASVLAFAHARNLAHRDVKPSNIFKTGAKYKLGDFGCFFMKRETSITRSPAGDARYMSPQLLEAWISGTPYNAFKADVFALGATLLHMATLTSPKALIRSERLDEAVDRLMETLPCSEEFQTLLRAMLAYEEKQRPTMQQVCSAISAFSDPAKTTLPRAQAEDDTPSNALELAHITSTFLRFFNFQTSTWGPQVPLRSRITADNYSTWVVLEGGRVVYSGGDFPSGRREAYLLSRDGAVEMLPYMHTARAFHGVIQARYLYVFGGLTCTFHTDDGGLKECEKMDLSSRRWTLLPNMREGRGGFSPCLWNGFVYLGGANSQLLEAFSPETDTFLPVQVQLPESTVCCLYVHSNCLVVHSSRHITKFAAGQGGQVFTVSQVRVMEGLKYSNSQPVVNPAFSCFFLIQEGSNVSFHMETGVCGFRV